MIGTSGEGADAGEVADSGKGAGAVEEAPVGGEMGTMELHRQCHEGGIVEGENELVTRTGGAPQKGCCGRSHDERESSQTVDGVIEPRGLQPGLEQEDVADFVQQWGRNVYLQGTGFHFLQEGVCLFQDIVIACLEPLAED
jgi:hypothetical protein